jgi:hypothetical protein
VAFFTVITVTAWHLDLTYNRKKFPPSDAVT